MPMIFLQSHDIPQQDPWDDPPGDPIKIPLITPLQAILLKIHKFINPIVLGVIKPPTPYIAHHGGHMGAPHAAAQEKHIFDLVTAVPVVTSPPPPPRWPPQPPSCVPQAPKLSRTRLSAEPLNGVVVTPGAVPGGVRATGKRWVVDLFDTILYSTYISCPVE